MEKIAIVTGGTSGIGLAISQLLASEDIIVYACARTETKFVENNIIFHKLDVTNKHSCEKLYEDIIKKHGKIDILVANSGITDDALTSKMTEEQFNNVMNTNLKGVFNVVKLVGPCMEKNGYGSIVNIASVVGEYGNIGQVNYAASKAGIIAMTKTWAKEFARHGANVRVNCVAPGFVETNMTKDIPEHLIQKFTDKITLKRFAKPKEIAQVVNFLTSDKASYVTGAVLSVNGGLAL